MLHYPSGPVSSLGAMLTASSLYQLLLLISCSNFCSTLFYTNSRENDYPRIGKRLEMFEVLKGKYSSPNYKETYKTQSQEKEGINAIDINKNTWDLGINRHSIYGETTKLEKELEDSRPIVITVQRKSENRHELEEDNIDDFLEMFQRINPDNML